MTDWIRQAALIAAIECRLQMASTFWRVMLLLSVVLAGAVTSASLQEYTRRQSEVDALIARRDLATEDGQHVIAGFQRDEALRVIRSPAPLSVIVKGLDKQIAHYWDFGPEGVTDGPAFSGDPTPSAASTDLDLEFMLRELIGMLALVAGFSSMVTSKYGGPTKSLASLPVHPSALVAGAMAGGTFSVALASAAIVAGALATVLAGNPSIFSLDAASSFVMIWFASTLYSAALVGIGAAVALTVPNTLKAVAAIAVLWLLITTIASPVTAAISEGIRPNNSRALFELARKAEYDEAIIALETDVGYSVLHGLDATEIPAGFKLSGTLLEMVEQQWDRRLRGLRSRLDDLESGFRQSQTSRATAAWWLSTFVPGPAFGYAVTELAGVGEVSAGRWFEAARDHHRALSSAVFDIRPRLHMRVRSGSGYRVVFHDRKSSPTVSVLPEFHQRTMAQLSRLKDAVPSIATLSLQGVALWLSAIFIFMRRLSSPSGWS